MRGKYSQTPTPFAHPSHTYVFMEYPTFGGDDGKLQLCVQSLDRKVSPSRELAANKCYLPTFHRERSIKAMIALESS